MPLELRCERDVLLDVLVTASRAVGRATGLGPAGLRLRVASGRLKATGTDRDLTISAETAVTGGTDGVAVVPARLMTDVVRALGPGQVTLSEPEDGKVAIESGRSLFSLQTYRPGDFPSISAPDGNSVPVEAVGLAEALRQVVRAASTEDARPVLQGVLVSQLDGGLRLVATDSYRLAIKDLSNLSNLFGEDRSAIVPGRALNELARLLASSAESVEVCLGTNDVRFDVGTTRLTARLIEGEYPPYRQLVHDNLPNRLSVDRAAFMAALHRVRLLAGATNGSRDDLVPVRLSLSSNQLSLSAATTDVGQAKEDLDAKYEGGDMQVAFNPAYLADGLEAATGGQVVLELSGPASQAILRSADDATFTYLMMPVRSF